MKILSVFLLAAFLAFTFWLFDIRGVQVLWHQHQAESFPSVQGTVRSSEMTITHGTKGSIHYHVSITYNYFVNGQYYLGRRYRYDGHPDNESQVDAIVSEHHPGSAVAVFYNPQNPADAVLSTRVDARDVYVLFLATPVCLLLLLLLSKAIREIDWGGVPVAGGVRVDSEMMVTRVRLPQFKPLTAGLAALAGLSLLAGILMAAGVAFGRPLTVGEWLLICVLLGGAVVYGWQFRNVHSGRQDLVIDEGARTIQLPLTYKRRAQTPVPFSEIEAVALKKVRHQSRSGVHYTYLVTLEMKDGSMEKLIDMNQTRAQTFATWLKEKFGFTAVVPELNAQE